MKVVIEMLDIKMGHVLTMVDTEVDTDVEKIAKEILKFCSGGAVFAGKEDGDLTHVKASTVEEAQRIVREHERVLCVPQYRGG